MEDKQIKKYLIGPDVGLKVAMNMLSASGNRILFVTDGQDRLIGSLTDGDIRRAILNNISFDTPVSQVMFKSPRHVKAADANYEDKVKRYISEEKLCAIPVVDGMKKVVDVLFWFDLLEEHPLEKNKVTPVSTPVVIMAGGKGSRLDPFTKILPKPLIPLDDKPIIEMIMDNFHSYGFTNFYLVLNYKKEMIKMYFNENKSPYNIKFIEEDEFLGTAGGLKLISDKIKEPFFVCNCDIMLKSNFKDILDWHKSENALATIIGSHKELAISYGTLEIDNGKLSKINEKPKFDMIINTGVYILEPKVLELISTNEHLDMNRLLERAMLHGNITVYPIYNEWFDLGQWKEYKESLFLLEKNISQ